MAALKWEQFSVMTVGYQQHSLEFALDSIRAAGFEKVELWGAEPHLSWPRYGLAEHRARVREIVQMLHARGLRMEVFTPEQLRTYPVNIASPDAEIQRWSEQVMLVYLEDTAQMGARVMELLPGWEYIDAQSPDNFARACEAMRRLCARAQELGVTLMAEPVAPCESTFVTDLPSLRRLIDAVGSPVLRPCIDLPTAAALGERMSDWLAHGLPAHVHLADGDPDGYLALGEGKNDVAGQLSALAQAGYSGELALYFNNAACFADPDRPVRTSALWLRESGLVR